jgi:hypothetical protein
MMRGLTVNEKDFVELKIAMARIEEKLMALAGDLKGFCDRQSQLNMNRQLQIDTVSSRIDLLESWRDKADGSMRIITFLSGAAVSLSVAMIAAYLKHVFGI